MDLFDLPLFKIFFSILKGHLILICLITISYLIEMITTLSLFVDQFKWKKSLENAEMLSDRDSSYYFLFMAGVFIFDIYKNNIEVSAFSIIGWLVMMIFLAIIFRKFHFKYQGVDPNKDDADFS